MRPLFTTGVTFAWILASLSLAAIFAVAYATRRREPEHLVFAFLSLAITVHVSAIDLALAEAHDSSVWRVATMIGFTAVLSAIAMLTHYALLFGGIRNRRLVAGLYASTAVAAAVIYPSGALDSDAIGSVLHHALGISLACTKSALSPTARAIGLVAATFAALSVAWLFRAYVRGRRDGLAACIGALVLVLALMHDFFVLDRVLPRGPWLTPPGFLGFAFGVGCSLLIRHAVLGKELERRTLELERSYAHLRATQAELLRKRQLAAIGELAAVIAHEVRNPLAIIMNATTGLHRRDLQETDEKMLLEILDEEARRLNRLVGDLLRFARPIQVLRQPVDVRNVIGRALHAFRAQRGIDVRIDEAKDVPTISGDPDLLRLVFGNLVDNAAQAMCGEGRLRVRIRSESRSGRDGVAIAIEDSGHGMDPDVQQRATDPFFTTRPSGTGLGLAIVDRIVEAHEGELRIESQPGRGTVVEVFLPAKSELATSDEGGGSGPISLPMPILETP